MDDQTLDKIQAVPNLDAWLTPSERAFRKVLLNRLVQVGRPVTGRELAEAANLPPAEGVALSKALQAKGLLGCNPGGEIAFAYPVSALPTPHRVTLGDGRVFFAMCAIDALGSAFEFAQDASVASSCSHCRMPLNVEVAGGRLATAVPDTIQVLHVDLEQYADWAASC